MRTREIAPRICAALLAALAVAGCAGTGAPDGWLPEAAESLRDPYGAWVTLAFVEPHDDRLLAGELLAVGADTVFVLTGFAAQGRMVGAPRRLVRKATVGHFDPRTDQPGGWVALGALSTLSHGVLLVATAPLWAAIGGAATSGHAHAALANYPDKTWEELAMYARFPQGPPPGLWGLGLRPKPTGRDGTR